MSLLELKNFQVCVDGKALFHPIELNINSGELVHLAGENGVGKTSLLKAILGIKIKYTGSINRNYSQVSYQSQTHNISSHLPFSIFEVIHLASGVSREQILELGLVDESLLSSSWNQASGGERQRSLLIRSLLAKSDLVLLDEPFNHLDRNYQEQALKLIKDNLETHKNRAIILVTHTDNTKILSGLANYKKLELFSYLDS